MLLITQRHGLKAHSYADDIQIHCSGKAVSAAIVISRVVACINDIGEWMTGNRLKLDTDKTQFIWHGTRVQLSKVNIDKIELDGVSIPMSTTVCCLGVMLDGELSFAEHIKRLSGCFYQLRQLWSIRRLLTKESAKTLVHATVLSRVDYLQQCSKPGVCSPPASITTASESTFKKSNTCGVSNTRLYFTLQSVLQLGCMSCSAGMEVRSYIDCDA